MRQVQFLSRWLAPPVIYRVIYGVISRAISGSRDAGRPMMSY